MNLGACGPHQLWQDQAC